MCIECLLVEGFIEIQTVIDEIVWLTEQHTQREKTLKKMSSKKLFFTLASTVGSYLHVFFIVQP